MYNLYLSFIYCNCLRVKTPEYFLKLAEDVNYEGDIYIWLCSECKGTETKTSIQFKFDNTNIAVTSEIYSPKKIFNIAN